MQPDCTIELFFIPARHFDKFGRLAPAHLLRFLSEFDHCWMHHREMSSARLAAQESQIHG